MNSSTTFAEKVKPLPVSRLLTVRQFSTCHPAFPEGGLRYLIFNGARTGFDKCIKRVGRKVLLDEQEFFLWIEKQNHHSI